MWCLVNRSDVEAPVRAGAKVGGGADNEKSARYVRIREGDVFVVGVAAGIKGKPGRTQVWKKIVPVGLHVIADIHHGAKRAIPHQTIASKARVAKEREDQRLVWAENPLRYRNQIVKALSKLREIERNDEKVDNFLIQNLSVVKTIGE